MGCAVVRHQLAVWSSGMIRASGARGPGFNSRNGPCCSTAKAPRALNPTMAPCRPSTVNSMIGCDVTVIYDASGLKFDALNIVDPATGFQIPAVLDGPRLEMLARASAQLGAD